MSKFWTRASSHDIIKTNIVNFYLKNIIDVINKIKKYTMEYLNEFESVKIIHTSRPDIDPADLNKEELIDIYNNKIDPITFYFNKIQVLNLK